MFEIGRVDRRRFLRGSGLALAIPLLGSLARAEQTQTDGNPRRLGCFYFADGVPMPLPNDPAYREWAGFRMAVARSLPLPNAWKRWNSAQ